jgi:hypothetical protein
MYVCSFGIYSAQVKQQFDLSQDEVDSIATAGFWPNLLGAAILPGLFNDRYGPRLTIAGAAACTSSGLLLFWLTMAGHLPIFCGSAPRQLILFEALRAWGNQWPTAAVLPTFMKSFPASREATLSILVVALLKSVGSLGGGLSVQLYLAFISPDQTGYVLFLAVSIFWIYISAVPVLVVFINPARGDPRIERRRFYVPLVLVFVMIGCILANAYISKDVDRGVRFALAGGLLTLFVAIVVSLGFDSSSCGGGGGGGSGGRDDRQGVQAALLLSGVQRGDSREGELPPALYGEHC